MDTETSWIYSKPPPSYSMATTGCEQSQLQLSCVQIAAISRETRLEKKRKLVCIALFILVGLILLTGVAIFAYTIPLKSTNGNTTVTQPTKIWQPNLVTTSKPVTTPKSMTTKPILHTKILKPSPRTTLGWVFPVAV